MITQSETLTFLFTDIEGSTGLWHEQPQAMKLALAGHDDLLRGTVRSHGGDVFKHTGDGLLAAFSTAAGALAAALDGQVELGGFDAEGFGRLRVRMAINAGDAEVRDGDYVGLTLNLTERLLAAGHGGQVLVSQAAQALAVDQLPAGSELIDLGEHAFSGVPRLERLFQLAHPHLEREFPPLRTKPAGLADQSRARVFLVDDHDLMRAGARGVLGEAVDIVGEADEVPAAIELIREREPDLVLVDVRMPGGGGLAVVKAVKATHPHIHFLALSAYDKPTDVIPMIRAGALGYLTKDVHREDFVPQVITAATGAIVYSPKLADLIRTALGPEGPDVVDPRVDLLTPRELEVVSLVSRALTNKEIARRLSTSPKTVESQLRSVFRKLQLTNRQEVVIWASGRGLAATS